MDKVVSCVPLSVIMTEGKPLSRNRDFKNEIVLWVVISFTNFTINHLENNYNGKPVL